MRAAWHVYHDQLVSLLTAPIEERRRYIRDYKPPRERALRLRLLHMATGLPRGPLWRASEEAGRVFVEARRGGGVEARRAYDEAWPVFVEAWRVFVEANRDEIARLHAEQCPDCPWDGKTIFRKPAS